MVHLDDGRTKVRGREGGRKGRPRGRELWCSIGTTVVPVGAESGLIRGALCTEQPGGQVADGLGGAQGSCVRPLLFSRLDAKAAQAMVGL